MTEELLQELERLATEALPKNGATWDMATITICLHETSWLFSNVDYINAVHPNTILDLIARIRELEAEREDASYGKLSRMYLAELVKRQRLEKEADWLAEQLHKIDMALHGEGTQKLCWREIAKGTVAAIARMKEQDGEQWK